MEEEPIVPSNASHSPPRIYRPVPLRTLEPAPHIDAGDSPSHAFTQATPPSANERRRSSDFLAQLNARLLRTYNARIDAEERERERDYGMSLHSRSSQNLNKSTLSGIYDDVPSAMAGERSMADTPWGTGAETPAHAVMGMYMWDAGMGSPDAGLSVKQQARRGTARGQLDGDPKRMVMKQARQGGPKYAIIAGKLAALFLFGSTYGLIISHLYESRQLAAVHVEGVSRRSWIYLVSWGLFGVVLGSLLPYVDLLCGSQKAEEHVSTKEVEKSDPPISEQINDVVRSVGAFIGIAFAIRRLPWQSTLQLTLTLALVNPALWYILDRSKPGLSFSLIVTSILTSFIFLSNPNVLPSPSLPTTTNITRLSSIGNSRPQTVTVGQELFAGVVSYENLAVITWVGSVLFCSCVCFGSIGRRLAILEKSGPKKS